MNIFCLDLKPPTDAFFIYGEIRSLNMKQKKTGLKISLLQAEVFTLVRKTLRNRCFDVAKRVNLRQISLMKQIH